MKLDRAEWTGTGAALLFHVALIGALSLSLAHVASVPEPPAMDVEFVEDVGETACPTCHMCVWSIFPIGQRSKRCTACHWRSFPARLSR